jgi:hypothetical protein
MKKNLLLVAVLTVSMLASAQAPSPYPYFSFKKNDGVTPTYSIPDAAISQAATLNAVSSGATTQGLGLQAVNFDQKSAFDASAYSDDYLKTCGPTPSAFPEATTVTVSAIRSWVSDDAGFVAGTTYSSQKEPWLGINGNPSTFRFSGGWYYYTVNFTEADEYEFFLRLRSGNMRLSKTVDGAAQNSDKIVTVQIFNKTDMATPLKTWTLNYGGITPNANPPATTVSTDESVSFYSWAKLDAALAPITGQAASFWSKAKDSYTIPATGEYVIKIIDPTLKVEGMVGNPGAGDANNAIGSFTFIKKPTATGTNNNKVIDAYANVVNRNVVLSSNVEMVEVYNITGSKVKTEKVANNQFSLSQSGVYMINMFTAEGSKIQKVVVK